MSELIELVTSTVGGFLWGWFLWVVILGVGLFLTVRLSALPLKKIPYGFKQLWQGRVAPGAGAIAPFSALMLSLSATIGTGNIVGVATAIKIGGPGALFWMWCSALVGMATKYAEAVCAVHYREKDKNGRYVGGPMYYIKNGLGSSWVWLGTCFAIFGALAGFGIGNAVQANSVADSLGQVADVPRWGVAVVLMVLVGLVLLGGLKRIAETAKALVPAMSLLYILMGLVVLAFHITDIPAAIALVLKSAFTPAAELGGFAGASILLAVRYGVARGIFSNEAGLGSAPIAHAAADTDSPVRQGSIAMLGTFIDTIILCSITGLVLIVTGAWYGDSQGAQMSQAAFASVLPYGDVLVSLALSIFAFTTILGWSYYGERCAQFLFGESIVLSYRILWVLCIPLGILAPLGVVWGISDVLNGLMALPNLIALVALSGVVVKLTRDYYFSAH